MPTVSPNKKQTEATLADLAIAQIGSKLPALVEHLLGVELVNANDEGTRAAAIAGFDVHGARVLVPILFLNGKLKGLEIMYLADEDTFTSASPAWVEYLVSQANHQSLGAASTPRPGIGAAPTEALRLFNRPPQVSKSAAWGSEDPKLAALMPCEFVEVMTWWTRPEAVTAPKTAALTIPAALRSLGPTVYRQFLNELVTDHPAVVEKFAAFHDLDELKVEFSPLERARDVIKRARLARPAVKTAAPKLQFIDVGALEANPAGYAPELKTAVLRDGLAALDKRAADEKSTVLKENPLTRFHTPTEDGLFELFNDRGEVVDALVFRSQFGFGADDNAKGDGTFRRTGRTMTVDPDKHEYFLCSREAEILCRPQSFAERERWLKTRDALPTIAKATTGGKDDEYIALTDDGRASLPFAVKAVVRVHGATTLVIRQNDERIELRIVEGQGDIRRRAPYVFVPDTTRVLKVKAAPGAGAEKDDEEILEKKKKEDKEKGKPTPADKTEEEMAEEIDAKFEDEEKKAKVKIRPGSPALLADVASREMGIKSLDVSKKNARFTLRQEGLYVPGRAQTSRPLSKAAAFRALVGHLGLGTEDAHALLDGADSNGPGRVWVLPPAVHHGKLAQLLPNTPFPLSNEGDEDVGIDAQGRRTTMPQFGAQEVNREETPVVNSMDQLDEEAANEGQGGNNYGGVQRGDVEFLMRAADANAQDVFDPAMIGMILKTNRAQEQIDEYLPDLVKSLDRCARILLLFYWRQNAVAEGFGKSDMPSLEDALLATIKQQGELILFLKQKTSAGGQKVDAFSNAGDN